VPVFQQAEIGVRALIKSNSTWRTLSRRKKGLNQNKEKTSWALKRVPIGKMQQLSGVRGGRSIVSAKKEPTITQLGCTGGNLLVDRSGEGLEEDGLSTKIYKSKSALTLEYLQFVGKMG